jgi:hypothetical protein
VSPLFTFDRKWHTVRKWLGRRIDDMGNEAIAATREQAKDAVKWINRSVAQRARQAKERQK